MTAPRLCGAARGYNDAAWDDGVADTTSWYLGMQLMI